MPWTEQQMRALQAKAHGAHLRAGLFSGISEGKAEEMTHEGLKRSVKHARRAREIDRKMKRH